MKHKNKAQFHMSKNVQFLLGFFVLFLGAAFLTWFLHEYNYLASGNDIWGHLFKSDIMYQGIKEGDWYPMYTKYWYNGIQPYRYWAPLPYYLVAFLQFLAGGDLMWAYCLFGGFAFLFGGLGWLIWGRYMGRVTIGTVFGILWFFLPENFRVFFCEGNLPRMLTTILVPYLIFFIWLFIKRQKNAALFGVLIFMCAMTFSHVMLSAMMGVGAFLFLFIYSIKKKMWKRNMSVIVMMLLSYALCGIWLIPALSGGLVGMDAETSASVMESLTYSLSVSLNPVNRLTGIVDTFYYGLSIVILSGIGILIGRKKEKAGYILAIIILLLTTTSAVPFLSKIPLSQLLWMMRFATIVYGFFLWSFLEWKSLRRYYCIIFVGIIIIDCIPSMSVNRYYTQSAGRTDDEIQTIKNITKQRVNILDLSAYGSYPSYKLCSGDDKIQYTFGWAWQGATTAPNIVEINTALEAENYIYVFDRSVELGNDTVMIRKDLVGKAGKAEVDMVSAANKAGYMLYQETNQAYIFHLNGTPNTFGMVTDYQGLAIGKYAATISMFYPSFETCNSYYIDDYTEEQLSRYKTLYLSGFEFHDIKKAEELIKKVSEKNIKVLIDMTHVPVDKKNNRVHFLDVYMQNISFTERFPTLYYKGNELQTLDFPETYEEWNTGYIEGVKNLLGTFQYVNQNLPFIGTNENENIVFMGLNFVFHSTETCDQNGFTVIDDILRVTYEELPKRELVPIDITYDKDTIKIHSEWDNVNTTLAALDTFQLESGSMEDRNHLIYVSKGDTVIRIVYPLKKLGLLVTGAGVVMVLGFYILVVVLSAKRRRRENEENQLEKS